MTPNCIHGAWKKHCPDLAIDFGGFDISEGLSGERLKYLEVPKMVGLEMEEDDVESLLESIGEELTTEDLDDLEQQWRRLEELEAGQQPETPQRKMTIAVLQEFFAMMTRTINFMENMDPDCKRSGLKRQKIMEVLAFYDDLLKKRRNAMQATLDRFFKKRSSEASTTSDEPITSDEPQPGTSTGRFTIPPLPSPPLETPPRVSSPELSPLLPSLLPSSSSSSDVDNPAPL